MGKGAYRAGSGLFARYDGKQHYIAVKKEAPQTASLIYRNPALHLFLGLGSDWLLTRRHTPRFKPGNTGQGLLIVVSHWGSVFSGGVGDGILCIMPGP